MNQKYPYIRLAKDGDYSRIWSIWMQEHIIRWMSFLPTSTPDDFRARYEILRQQSDIYVMIDHIDGQEQIVGVRRIKYLKGKYAHTAEFCSMGIDKTRTRNGYGQKFTEEFEKIVISKNIKRVQLTQSGGNIAAFSLADKNGYSVEAVFADWLERVGKGNSYSHFVIERFIYKIIDKELQSQAVTATKLSYDAKLPSLKQNLAERNLKVTLNNNKIVVSSDQIPVLEFEYHPDNSVIKHIGFLDNFLLHFQDMQLCQDALRMSLQFIADLGQVKKLEFFTSDPKIVSLCQNLGFWVRGERIASYYDNGHYSNELGVEYSFFGINETTDFLNSFNLLEKNPQLKESLQKCQQVIESLVEQSNCDQLGNKYLQNIVYQMVRDGLQDINYVSLKDQPWQNTIKQCPDEIQFALQNLHKQLQLLVLQKDNSLNYSGFFQVPTTTVNQVSHCNDIRNDVSGGDFSSHKKS